MKAVNKAVRKLSIDCESIVNIRFVGKLSRIHTQAIKSLVQSVKQTATIGN
jgi:hypothetical protein